MPSPSTARVLLLSLALLPLSLLGQGRPRTTPDAPCLKPFLPLTRMGLATGYVWALQRVAVAESLTIQAIQDSTRDALFASNPEVTLADRLYTLSEVSREYRCAGQALDDFRAAPDSATRNFTADTRTAFTLHAEWVRELTDDLRRRLRGDTRPLVVEAEHLANMRRRRDALRQLLAVTTVGLTFVLLERQSGDTSRLALTSLQRDSLVVMLRQLAAGRTKDAPISAKVLIAFLTDKWPTR